MYKKEFPDYDETIEIPDGFVDVSWHNDACPSICKSIDDNDAIVIYCDYKDPAKRRDGCGIGLQFVVAFEEDGLIDDASILQFEKFEDAVACANSLYMEKTT
jgi:hypothetical protein